jgi:hypothetical protein
MSKHYGAVVEVPKELVQRKQSEIINDNPREKVIVLDLARRAALGTFPTVPKRVWDWDCMMRINQFRIRIGSRHE